MGIPKLWGINKTDNGGGERGFVYSHVMSTYYNWKNKILLKDKLDEMDALIEQHAQDIAEKLVTNEALSTTLANYVAKAMLSNVDINSKEKIPTSALIHALSDKITENTNAITALNADKAPFIEFKEGVDFDCNSLNSEKKLIIFWVSNVTNFPWYNGVLIHFASVSSTTSKQVALRHGNINDFYMTATRNYFSGSGTWTQWKDLSGKDI